MKKILILAAIAAVTLTSCRSNGGHALKNEADSLAYVIGLNVGYNLKYNTDSTLDVDVLCAAIRDMYDDTQLMDMDEAGAFYRQYYNVVKPRRAREASEKFLSDAQRENPAIRKSDSGLLYLIEQEGDTVRASASADRVRVMYRATTRDGREFESTYAKGDTVEFALGDIVKGLSEGLAMVGRGGRIKLWVPSALGYGASGNRKVGGNEALYFEVEVADVIPAEPEDEE